jgi:hypothetical protein
MVSVGWYRKSKKSGLTCFAFCLGLQLLVLLCMRAVGGQSVGRGEQSQRQLLYFCVHKKSRALRCHSFDAPTRATPLRFYSTTYSVV